MKPAFGLISDIFSVLTLILFIMVSVIVDQTLATPKDNQTIPIQKFVPSPKENQTIPIQKFVPRSPVDEFDMEFQLTPHTQYTGGLGDYGVLGWQLALSNPSGLCPTQNCAFQLDGARVYDDINPGEKMLMGKIRITSSDTTQIKDLSANWAAIEERVQGGQTVQFVQGTLGVGIGSEQFNRANQYQINGTLAPYGQDLILTIHGVKE